MKILECRKMGADCDYVVKGKTLAEVRKKMWAHARSAHPQILKGMTTKKRAQMEKMMSKLVREVK